MDGWKEERKRVKKAKEGGRKRSEKDEGGMEKRKRVNRGGTKTTEGRER